MNVGSNSFDKFDNWIESFLMGFDPNESQNVGFISEEIPSSRSSEVEFKSPIEVEVSELSEDNLQASSVEEQITPDPCICSSVDQRDSNLEQTSSGSCERKKIPDWILRQRKKPFVPKSCGVCDKLARSSHFGGICCDGCKAFFRRAVKNDSHYKFKCSAKKECSVVGRQRKFCQACRFNKCLSIGMKPMWVKKFTGKKSKEKVRRGDPKSN